MLGGTERGELVTGDDNDSDEDDGDVFGGTVRGRWS